MSRVKVKQEIEVYEIDGEAVGIGETVSMAVNSHWNRNEFVVIGFNGKELTVVGDDLKTAIKNAENSGRI